MRICLVHVCVLRVCTICYVCLSVCFLTTKIVYISLQSRLTEIHRRNAIVFTYVESLCHRRMTCSWIMSLLLTSIFLALSCSADSLAFIYNLGCNRWMSTTAVRKKSHKYSAEESITFWKIQGFSFFWLLLPQTHPRPSPNYHFQAKP